jgi:hypothetical protein
MVVPSLCVVFVHGCFKFVFVIAYCSSVVLPCQPSYFFARLHLWMVDVTFAMSKGVGAFVGGQASFLKFRQFRLHHVASLIRWIVTSHVVCDCVD